MFRRLLIANRGEIAIRVARTARAMGLRCIGIYSEADRGALHRKAMDESLEVGGALPSQSYLSIEHILDAARSAGVDAIHPGYGFLSESADFARRCAEERVVFVGPPPKAMALTGDKIASRRAMMEAGVPVTVGMDRVLRSVDDARVSGPLQGHGRRRRNRNVASRPAVAARFRLRGLAVRRRDEFREPGPVL